MDLFSYGSEYLHIEDALPQENANLIAPQQPMQLHGC